MSRQKIIRKLCEDQKIPEEFIKPTISYFQSHDKLRPKLYSSFLKRAKNIKRIKEKPQAINLDFSPLINVSYNYIKIKGSDKYILADKVEKGKIIAAKNWKRDDIKNPKFKINFNTPEGIRVRMHIRGDGGITKSGYIFYSNKEKELINSFKKDFFNLFGECKHQFFGIKLSMSKTPSKVFIDKLGYLTGHEHKYEWGIDQDIRNSDLKLKAEAIKAYFDDEGRFHANSLEIVKSKDISFLSHDKLKKVISNSKDYSKYAPKLLLDLKEMLEDFGIEVSNPYFYRGDLLITIDNDNYLRLMVGWRLRISAEKNIKIFDEKIGFSQKKKDKKVKFYLNNIKVHKAQRNRSWLLAYEMCQKLKCSKKVINFPNLLNISNRSKTQVRRWITDLKKRGLLKPLPYKKVGKRDKEGKFISINSKEYKLVNK